MLTTDELARLRGLLAAAAPERWKVDADEFGTEIVTDVCSEVYRGHVASCTDAEDAALIVAAVNALPELLRIAEAVDSAPEVEVRDMSLNASNTLVNVAVCGPRPHAERIDIGKRARLVPLATAKGGR